MNYKRPVSVLVVIHTPEGSVLLLERVAHAGYWQSVTGSQEAGESLFEVARREVLEETGITADQGQWHDWRLTNRYLIYPQWRHRYGPGVDHNLEHVFSLELPQRVDVRLSPDEHRASCWLPWREAALACFSWSNRDAIRMLAEQKQLTNPKNIS